ncbi:MAG TPA: T9SS type A sorting domain-containing protein [Bacteroidia bacterium]|jgi:hypothetical protein
MNISFLKKIIFYLFSFLVLFQCSKSFSQNWSAVGEGVNANVKVFYSDALTNRLYIGGQYVKANGYWDGITFNSMACGVDWDCTTPLMDNNFTSPVNSIIKYNGEIYIGGGFTLADAKPVRALAKWTGSTWDSVGTCPSHAINDMHVSSNNELIAGGWFNSIGGITAHGVAVWNGSAWSSPGGGLPLSFGNYAVNAVCEFMGEIYVTGNFSDNNAQINEIAKWNGTNWVNPGLRLYGGSAHVNDLIVYENELYAGGLFLSADGNLTNQVIKYNGTSWTDVGGGMQGTNGQLFQFAIHNGELYTVGAFAGAGGVPAEYIAKWDGAEWCGFGTDFSHVNISIGSHNGELYIGCGKTIQNDTVNYIAKWDGAGFVDTCGAIMNGIENTTGSNHKIYVYPNPATNFLTIEYDLDVSNLVLEIRNTLGQTIQSFTLNGSANKVLVDVNEYPPGIYFLLLQNEEKTLVKKFIKE